MRSIIDPVFSVACVLLGATASVCVAADPEPLQEVVVTATLRGEHESETPASTTVLGRETLREGGVQHFEDVLGLVPNLNWSAGTSRPRYFQLRGIGELEQFQGAPNASVGFLIDDIDFSGIGMPATLFDVEQIEVLRGPQGTTYGANALGGLVSVRTREPTPELDLRGEATVGDYGTRSIGAVIGGGLGDSGTSAVRLAAQRYESDGFRRNAYLGRDDTNGFDETTVRGKLHWGASDDLDVDLVAMFVDLDNGYDAFSIDNSRVTLSDDPGRDAQRSKGVAARLEYTGLDGIVLRSITTAADTDVLYSFDGDWGNDVSWGIYAPYDFNSRFDRTRRTVSQELRVLSAPGTGLAGGRIAWLAGIYALDARETNAQLDVFNGEIFRALESRYDAVNTAAYGELDITLTPRTSLSVGARVEHRDSDYEDTDGSRFDPAETMTGGHVSLEFRPAERRNYYVTLSRGYKAGNFNIGPLVPEDRRMFDAEYLWNLETGVKARSADGRFVAQGALFYMRREDQQVSASFQLDPDDPLSYVFITDNAARGKNYGVESSLAWRATERLELAGTLGILKTRYIGYRFGDLDLDGREQAHAPEYQASLSAQYRDPRGFFARADVERFDDFYFDTSNDEKAPAATLVNARIGYETPRWSASVWVRNLFDTSYAMRGFFFSNEPPDFPVKRYVQAGDPRQIGLTLSYNFD